MVMITLKPNKSCVAMEKITILGFLKKRERKAC